MDRDGIIHILLKCKYIKTTCKIAGNLQEDLFQHIWVKILELPSDKLINIYEKGYLDFYIIRMIKNEAYNANNPFLKTIQGSIQKNITESYIEIQDISETYDIEDDILFESNIKSIKEKLKNLYWYDRAIFEIYLVHKSLRKVAAETGIKYGAIHQTIQKVKKQLNESITNRD